jgi:NADH-quinone oxidoreductase subunit K
MLNYLLLSLCIFIIGLWGFFLIKKHLILILISLEIILLAINLNFFIFSVYLDDIMGQLFSLFVLTVAAAESAIGLAILLVYYRLRGSIMVDFLTLLKG